MNIIFTSKERITNQLEVAQFVKLALAKVRYISAPDKVHQRAKCRHGILALFATVTQQQPEWMIDELLKYRQNGEP